MTGKRHRSQRGLADTECDALLEEIDRFVATGAGPGYRGAGRLRGALAFGVVLILTLSMVLAVSPPARAYGSANWQAAFSGNFVAPGVGNAGFWGWCDFAGSTDGGASGNEADCTLTAYFLSGGIPGGALFHQQISGTEWDTRGTTFFPPFFPTDFFINAGTATLTGPTIAGVIASGAPPPPGCTVNGSTATCPIAIWEGFGLFNPDTGIPTAPGKYSAKALAELLGFPLPPGTQINISVTRVS